jgi:hypothetical protein
MRIRKLGRRLTQMLTEKKINKIIKSNLRLSVKICVLKKAIVRGLEARKFRSLQASRPPSFQAYELYTMSKLNETFIF